MWKTFKKYGARQPHPLQEGCAKKLLCIIQKKMEVNKNGRQSYLGNYSKVKPIKPMFRDVTLACEEASLPGLDVLLY